MKKAAAIASRGSTYLLDNCAPEARARFAALEALFDPGTIRHLNGCGVAPGWTCLEVGAGGGSIAKWLVDRVGLTGHVVAMDIEPRFLESLRGDPNIEVRRHNIVKDPLPEAAFDLVHTRLVLVHLPERDRVLERLIAALKPGGWIITEEFDTFSVPSRPLVDGADSVLTVHMAMTQLLTEHGANGHWARLLFGRLRTLDLTGVEVEGRIFMARAGSPGLALMRANYEQLHGEMIATGYITRREFDVGLERLNGVDFVMTLPIMWAAWGRRP